MAVAVVQWLHAAARCCTLRAAAENRSPALCSYDSGLYMLRSACCAVQMGAAVLHLPALLPALSPLRLSGTWDLRAQSFFSHDSHIGTVGPDLRIL